MNTESSEPTKIPLIVPLVIIIGIGLNSLLFKYPLNLSGDPLGAPPKGTTPNCGPEHRYEFDVAINSKNAFASFIKNNQTNLGTWVRLDNFRDNPEGDVNWDKVVATIETERIARRTVYVLNYRPDTCSGYTLKMTDDGRVSNYGCCGK